MFKLGAMHLVSIRNFLTACIDFYRSAMTNSVEGQNQCNNFHIECVFSNIGKRVVRTLLGRRNMPEGALDHYYNR